MNVSTEGKSFEYGYAIAERTIVATCDDLKKAMRNISLNWKRLTAAEIDQLFGEGAAAYLDQNAANSCHFYGRAYREKFEPEAHQIMMNHLNNR